MLFKLICLISFLTFNVSAGRCESLHPLVKISIEKTSEITIEAEMPQPSREWSFRNAYAGALNLADRIDNFEAIGIAKELLPVRKVTIGEYRSDQTAESIRYKVNATSRGVAEISRVSWLNQAYGCLMLADLLPTLFDGKELRVELKLPSRWSFQFAGALDSDARAIVRNSEDTVFLVGQDLRRVSKSSNGQRLNLAATGKWKLSDGAIVASAQKIFELYLRNIGYKLAEDPLIMVVPFPFTGGTSWRAQTRGSTVVLAIDPSSSFRNWKGQLGVIFTHELLHLWVPNSLSLKGEYDWFFEGFTLYEALLTALQAKLISFQEYLDTLARVYDSYLSYPNDLSLIEASERRWTSSFPLVYDKGMLVALLYDLMVRAESDGRSSLSNVYRQLLHLPHTQANDANAAIISLLDSSLPDRGFSQTYIEGKGSLDLTASLKQFGIIFDSSGNKSRVTIDQKLTSKQLGVLKSIGYRQ
jgi:predicted metalloprotease with PDZ domain